MVKQWEVQWEGELAASPQAVWDAITRHADGYLWQIEYEPRVGGAERGLTAGGGTVTAWEPLRHFATRPAPSTSATASTRSTIELEPHGAATLPALHAPRRDARGRLRPPARRLPPAHELLLPLARPVRVRTSPAASRSTSASTGRRPPPRAASSRSAARSASATTWSPATASPDARRARRRSRAWWTTPRAPFLGVRSADALYRVYGRDTWGWPAGVAHHLFADGWTRAASRRAWTKCGRVREERVA